LQRRRCMLSSVLRAWAVGLAAEKDERQIAERRRRLGAVAAEVEKARRGRSKRMGKPRSRSTQQVVEDEQARFRRLNSEAARALATRARAARAEQAKAQARAWWMQLVWRVWVDAHRVMALVREGCWDVAQCQLQLFARRGQLQWSDGTDLFMAPPALGGVAVTIVVESCQPGGNPGDVLTCTASFGGLAEAGTLSSFHLVPCYTPTFSCGDSVLCWEVSCGPLSEEGVGDGRPEPEPEEEGAEEWNGVARLLVVGGSRSGARGFPLATVVEPNGVGLTRFGWQSHSQQRAQFSADRAFGNQLDAWASGLGDWGGCETDDDDDFDGPGAWCDSAALDEWGA